MRLFLMILLAVASIILIASVLLQSAKKRAKVTKLF